MSLSCCIRRACVAGGRIPIDVRLDHFCFNCYYYYPMQNAEARFVQYSSTVLTSLSSRLACLILSSLIAAAFPLSINIFSLIQLHRLASVGSIPRRLLIISHPILVDGTHATTTYIFHHHRQHKNTPPPTHAQTKMWI